MCDFRWLEKRGNGEKMLKGQGFLFEVIKKKILKLLVAMVFQLRIHEKPVNGVL